MNETGRTIKETTVTNLVRSCLCENTKISNIHSSFERPFVRSIKNGIKRDVLQHFVYAQFVRIEKHSILVGSKNKGKVCIQRSFSTSTVE
jgi:hypothetical protein